MVAILKAAFAASVLAARLSSGQESRPTTLVKHTKAFGTSWPGPVPTTTATGKRAETRPTTLLKHTQSFETRWPRPAPTAVEKRNANSISTRTTGTYDTRSPYWAPAAGSAWQIDLSGTVSDVTAAYDVFDVDLFDTPTSTITALHNNDKKVICYFSAGSYENWRSDASEFVAADLGNALDGWPGEWWVDTNSANVRTIMTARIQLALTKGCDGIDPDNVDGYNNDAGLDLTEDDAVSYLTYLADAAHARGLAMGLKNAGEIVGSVVSFLEWVVNEQCEQYDECDIFTPFITAGKPVFHIEYPDNAPSTTAAEKGVICDASLEGFSTVLKSMDLDAWIEAC